MYELLLWSLVVYSFTSIVTTSKVFESFRNWWYKGYKWVASEEDPSKGKWELDGSRSLRTVKICWKIGDLLKCPMCTGFWVGLGFSVAWYSPTAFMGGNWFCDALLGSTFAYILHSLIWRLEEKG